MLLWGQRTFNATQIPGLQAWYDFSDSSYLTLDSAAITQALDRSGNGNNTAVQGTGTARPTFTASQVNGLPAAVGDGGDFLVLPSTLYTIPNGANTVFIVSKRASEDGTIDFPYCFGESGVSNRNFIIYAATAGRVEFRSNTGSGSVISTGNTNTNFNIITGRRSGTTEAISVNGGAEVTGAGGANSGTINIGNLGVSATGSLFLTGSIAEWIIYNRSLSLAERTQVNRYLANKYGIALA